MIPELSDLAVGLRAEWRAEEEQWMRAAAQRWAHRRGIPELVREYAARGDRVAIEVGAGRFAGHVVALGGDWVDLETGAGVVTVRLTSDDGPAPSVPPLVIRRSRASRAGGVRLPATRVTFRARLLELEDAGRPVRVGLSWSGLEVTGPLVVGRDHVVVLGDGEVALPVCWVGYVVADGDVSA